MSIARRLRRAEHANYPSPGAFHAFGAGETRSVALLHGHPELELRPESGEVRHVAQNEDGAAEEQKVNIGQHRLELSKFERRPIALRHARIV